jgi:hypothetical protein
LYVFFTGGWFDTACGELTGILDAGRFTVSSGKKYFIFGNTDSTASEDLARVVGRAL